MHGGGESCLRLLPWVPKLPVTSKNSAHNCCLALRSFWKAVFSTITYQCPGSPPEPVASHSEIGSGPDTSGILVPPVPVCFFCISKSRLWKEEGSGCSNLFPCHLPLTCLAPVLGPPLLPLGIRVITPRCLQRKHLVMDLLESSHPRCRRIVCVLSHLISISANIFYFCCSYNRSSQS